MRSSAFPLVVMLLFVTLATVISSIARVEINAYQASKNAERYAAQAVTTDARLHDACAKHHTGIVLFYKGVNCNE